MYACAAVLQIDEVAQVGLHFLEQQRQSFLQTLEK
jgi:hypothetical protein